MITTGLRLHLGCGNVILEDYCNVDLYDERADCRDDARTLLSFGEATVDEIRAELILEHLGYEDGRRALRRWHELLRPGGRLDVIVPDTLVNVRRWLAAHEAGDSKLHGYCHALWGTQTGEGQYHRWGYTKQSLAKALADAGFVDLVIADLPGGNCIRGEGKRL